MEQALGLHFQGDEGAAFFRSSLVQTLFYGLFSGWMLWRQNRRNGDRFDWKGASEYLALPLIGDLYEEIARPRRLADLGLREPLEWATASLNRVVEEEFFQRFQTDHAITLFYEPFLQAFDPELRKELGVWYTPPEIVAVHGRAGRSTAPLRVGHRRRTGRRTGLRARSGGGHRLLPGRGRAADPPDAHRAGARLVGGRRG